MCQTVEGGRREPSRCSGLEQSEHFWNISVGVSGDCCSVAVVQQLSTKTLTKWMSCVKEMQRDSVGSALGIFQDTTFAVSLFVFRWFTEWQTTPMLSANS